MGIEIIGEDSLALQLWPCGYRAKCSAPDCANLARIIVRRVAHGKFDGQSEYCHKDSRKVIEAAKARGIAIDDVRVLGRNGGIAAAVKPAWRGAASAIFNPHLTSINKWLSACTIIIEEDTGVVENTRTAEGIIATGGGDPDAIHSSVQSA